MLKGFIRYFFVAPYKYIKRDIEDYKDLKRDIKNLNIGLVDALSDITFCRDEAEPSCGCVTNYIYYIGKGPEIKRLGYYKRSCPNFNGRPCKKEECLYSLANHKYYGIREELNKKKQLKKNFWINKLQKIK